MSDNGWLIDNTEDEPPIDEDEDFEILDKTRDRDTGELLSFLVIEDGEPVLKRATTTNILLYEHGLKEFLSGEYAIILSEDEPEVIVAPTGNDKAYLIRVNGSTVETTPDQSSDLLEALKNAIDADTSHQYGEAVAAMESIYDDIMSNQVRRWMVKALKQTFDADERQRISEVSRGWLIDGFYLVTWDASLYVSSDDPDSEDYSVSGGSATATDKSYEFLRLTPNKSPGAMEVRINGDTHRVTEREMLFLSKVRFMLDRRYYHNDKPWWDYNDKLGSATNLEKDKDKDSFDKFSL